MQPIRSLIRSLLSRLMPFILILIIDSIGLKHAYGIRAPPPVEINKCCRIGETLNRNRQCLASEIEHWWPPIYLIGKQAYFPKQGEAPRFLRAQENKQPDCENPELILNNIALFSNGSLFLGERNYFINMENYCIDKDVALVCLKGADSLKTPTKLTKVRKCCSLNSVYLTHAQTCVQQSEEIPLKLTSHIDLVYGFPVCSVTNNKYVIADQYHEHNLNIDDGTYVLGNAQKILKNDEFCIEHTNQNSNSVTGTVIACDDLVAITEAPELKNEEVSGCAHFL